jgi:hypothetical protein
LAGTIDVKVLVGSPQGRDQDAVDEEQDQMQGRDRPDGAR